MSVLINKLLKAGFKPRRSTLARWLAPVRKFRRAGR